MDIDNQDHFNKLLEDHQKRLSYLFASGDELESEEEEEEE